MISEKEAIDKLRRGELHFPPLAFRLLESETQDNTHRRYDALIQVNWRNRSYEFGVEYKSLSTPKAFQEAIQQALHKDRKPGAYPLVMMPYLSEAQLRELEAREVSGIDLCGNGVIVVPDELLAMRTGAPNKFPNSTSIKNIYRKSSSIVARVFLLQSEYTALNEIQAAINNRNGNVAISTVSKVVKRLEEDMIVGRDSGKIRLIQPEKLLDRLAANYERPDVTGWWSAKTQKPLASLMEGFVTRAKDVGLRLAASGVGSTGQYGAMAQPEILSCYCSDPRALLICVGYEESPRFPNLEIARTDDESVYFDTRYQNGFLWASPVQAYLELMAGDERDKKTAEQVKEVILKEVERQRA